MGHRHVGRALRIDNTVLANVGTLSCIRTRGRLGHCFNIIDVFTDGPIRVTERSITDEKDLLKLNCNLRKTSKDYVTHKSSRMKHIH